MGLEDWADQLKGSLQQSTELPYGRRTPYLRQRGANVQDTHRQPEHGSTISFQRHLQKARCSTALFQEVLRQSLVSAAFWLLCGGSLLWAPNQDLQAILLVVAVLWIALTIPVCVAHLCLIRQGVGKGAESSEDEAWIRTEEAAREVTRWTKLLGALAPTIGVVGLAINRRLSKEQTQRTPEEYLKLVQRIRWNAERQSQSSAKAKIRTLLGLHHLEAQR